MAAETFYVYVHSRLSSGDPFYVGKGRGRRACSNDSRSQHWKNIVAKDGGRYVNIIAEHLDEEFAFLVEMEVIDKCRRGGCNLVNRTDGGDGRKGYKCTDEQRRKLSERIITPEWRIKMSESAKGRKLTPEQRAEMSARMKADPRVKARRFKTTMKGFKHTEESRAKMSEGMKGRKSHNRRIVRCVDTGEVFESATAAAKHLGRKQHTLIAACCNGAVKTAYGLRFEYKNG